MLLDTHVLVWLAQEPERIGTTSHERISQAIASGDASISAITHWEIGMLVCKGRLKLGRPPREWLEVVLTETGIAVVPINIGIGVDAGCLPGTIHGDPADRLVVATARAMEMPVITADRAILDYAAAGHVRAIDARV